MGEVKQLAEAMLKARQGMTKVHKTSKNTHHGYDYASLEDILNVVEKPLAENDLVVLSSVEELIAEDSTNRVLVKLKTTLLHKSGEFVEQSCWGEGVDKQDKATYKAITGARKYALACMFNLVTTDEPEADNVDRSKKTAPRTAAKTEPPKRNGDNYDFLAKKLESCKTPNDVHAFGLDYKKSINDLPDDLKGKLVARAVARAQELQQSLKENAA